MFVGQLVKSRTAHFSSSSSPSDFSFGRLSLRSPSAERAESDGSGDNEAHLTSARPHGAPSRAERRATGESINVKNRSDSECGRTKWSGYRCG